jgi:hypothetical protein
VLNLLHLLAVLAIGGCLYALWREARGISQSRGHLMVAPPLAFGCALLMIGLTEPDLQQPDVLRIAIAAGVLLGAARGWFMAVDIDPLWSTVRLPGGSDGFWLAILLALVASWRPPHRWSRRRVNRTCPMPPPPWRAAPGSCRPGP